MKLTMEKYGRSEVLMVEDAGQADILPGSFRNFRGEKRKAPNGKIVNDEGNRNFNLALNLQSEDLDDLAAKGLNIKEIPPKNDEYGDEPLRFVKVNVAYGGKYPPSLYLVGKNKKMKELTESQLALLDGARFTKVDLVIRTYHKDETSTTLYLQKGYFTIEQDPISEKYADMDVVGEAFDEEVPFD